MSVEEFTTVIYTIFHMSSNGKNKSFYLSDINLENVTRKENELGEI